MNIAIEPLNKPSKVTIHAFVMINGANLHLINRFFHNFVTFLEHFF